MNLRVKKLMKMPTGTHLEVHYGNGKVFAGIITDKDDECIAISDGNKEIVIDYEDIELYIEGIDNTSCSSQKKKIEAPGVSAEKKHSSSSAKPSFEIQIEKTGVSDNCLKTAFSAIDPSAKKKLNNRYNSFMYALRIMDVARAKQCFNSLMEDINDDESLYCDNNVWKFAALMSSRCGCANDEILIKGNCFFRAAINAYLEERFSDAGAFACLAVLYDSIEDVRDAIYSIIFNCCIKCNDTSAAAKMLKNSDASEYNTELLRSLLAVKGETLGKRNMSQAIDEINLLYGNAEMMQKIQLIIEKNQLEDTETKENNENDNNNDNDIDIAEADTQVAQCTGQIVKLAWSKEEGTIEYGDDILKSCVFSYDSIVDDKLKQEVMNTLFTNVEDKKWYVTFDLTADKALNIRENQVVLKEKEKTADLSSYSEVLNSVLPEDALNIGRRILASRADTERFAEAADMFEIAIECERDRTDALSELINACVAYKNALKTDEKGVKYLNLALKKYREFDSEINHDFKYDVAAFGLTLKYGEMHEKIIANERLLNYNTVKPQQRLVYICSLADTYLKEAELTDDEELLKKAKVSYQEWEALFCSNAFLFSAPSVNKIYYTKILVNLALCLMKLDENEQAEQILTKVLKYDSSIEAANKMYNELLGGMIDESEEAGNDISEDEELYAEEDENYNSDYCTENIQPYTDVANWSILNISEKQAIDYILSLRGKNKSMYTVSLLKVISDSNNSFLPLYKAVCFATDNPLDRHGYSASDILQVFGGNSSCAEMTIAYSFAAATLRSAFYQSNGADYMLNALCDSIQICSKYPRLRQIFDTLIDFKTQNGKGADTFAAYHFSDISTQESKLSAIVSNISQIYEHEFKNKLIRENIKQIRFKLTKVFVYEKGGVLETTLRCIKDNDINGFEAIKESFAEYFIRSDEKIKSSNIQDSKVDAFIDKCWERAGRDARVSERKTSDLMGSLRNNIKSHITNIISVICDWVEIYETGLVATIDSKEKRAFAKIEQQLIIDLNQLYSDLIKNIDDSDDDEYTGICLLSDTVDELARKMTGNWSTDERKYYFADFLSSNNILLDENYLPDFSSTFYSLPSFNVYSRLCNHIESVDKGFDGHIKQIYSRNQFFNNFGTAELLEKFVQQTDAVCTCSIPENANEYCEQAEARLRMSFRQFLEDIQLANGKGQIMLYDEFMNSIEDTAVYWYNYSLKTKNYGFFFEFIDACMEKIHIEASAYKEKLLGELDDMYKNSQDLFKDIDTKFKVQEQIESLNFLVAEDWMNRLRREDFYDTSSDTAGTANNLVNFWSEFDRNYDSAKDAGATLKIQVNRGGHIPAKDKRGGISLINNWLSNGNKASCAKIQVILNALGWENIEVSDVSSDIFERYRVKSVEKYTRKNYPHPIAAFGTASKNSGFEVVCLYGFYSADRLINEYKKLDNIARNKIILLDYALNGAERRRLARKVKEITLFNTYIFIDRVSIIYIANHYVSGMNNEILMSISIPFSYYQPYEVSAINMAPEMFIGRRDELLSIESPTGANLIFGGRQLGKSSLLMKAKNEIDGDELGRKAVVIDMKEADYKAAALKITKELAAVGILDDEKVTSDWNELETAIIERLRDEDNDIPYLLLMLDEADCLIESSKQVSFLPIVKLKNIQQNSNGRFKFVLAGLHDLVRFNRSVALGRNSVIAHLSYINIKPFIHEDAEKLLLTPLSYLGFSFENDSVLISQILASTNYFPGLIQLYCKKLIETMKVGYAGYNENTTPPYIVTESHIKKVLSDKHFREEIKNKFEITLRLDDAYYIIALIMASLDDLSENKNGYSSSDILAEAQNLKINLISELDKEQVDAFLGELVDLNVLKSTGSGLFSFSTKNFRDMLGSKNDIEEKLLSLMC